MPRLAAICVTCVFVFAALSPQHAHGNPYIFGNPLTNAFGYPYGIGGFPFGLGSPYRGYGYPDAGDRVSPDFGRIRANADPGAPLQPESGSVVDRMLSATGIRTYMGRPVWPLGLRILPGAAPLRERVDALYATIVSGALSGRVDPALDADLKRAVHKLRAYLVRDRIERMTLSSAMYEQAGAFLQQLQRSARALTAMSSGTSNLYGPFSAQPKQTVQKRP